MPEHRETRILPYRPEDMYALVADVARYGEFLPWVVATRIRSDSDSEMIADMIVGFRQLREKFTSRVLKDPHRSICVEYLDGPLRNLENRWDFAATGDGHCQLDFHVAFNFRNRMFEMLAGQYFDKAFRKMVGAFEDRADQLYGNSSSSAV
ncbi:MAG: type II toxin-antitoxin system RatA family toxin [Blastomonas sp.]